MWWWMVCWYFKKDKAIWYFSRQLCKAFVSIRRLKTTEIIFIGGWSITHELVSLFKHWVNRKTNAADKVRSKREGQRSVVSEAWTCVNVQCQAGWTEKKGMRQICIYLAASGSHSKPSLPLPLLGNLTCNTGQDQWGQKCLLLPQPWPAFAQRGHLAGSSPQSIRQTPSHSPKALHPSHPEPHFQTLLGISSGCRGHPWRPPGYPRPRPSLLGYVGKWRENTGALCIQPACSIALDAPGVQTEKNMRFARGSGVPGSDSYICIPRWLS